MGSADARARGPAARGRLTGLLRDPGSFRDPDSSVLYDGEGVLRGLTERALADWSAFSATQLYPRLVESGKLVGTQTVDRTDVAPELADGWAALLRHERIPFVSYPYEWTFRMLRDAALLQLELLLSALDEDLTLKDATPYNVQWRGTEPVFIDVGSFERLPEGEPWQGYRQFCMLFLNPLLLQAYKSVPFQPWLRGSLGGIAPGDLARLMSMRDRFRRGVLTHVILHARLERKHEESTKDVRGELRKAGFRKELIAANVRRLEKLVRSLDWRPGGSEWSDYGVTTSYDEEGARRKEAFVREAVHSRRWELVWDVGCNEARFSRIAAENARYVVALDGDAAVVDRAYRELASEGRTDILPLVADVTDPSPALGWSGLERQTLAARGRPELTLCLAVVHHVAISGNVPVPEFLTWLRELGTALVIEFPTREDPRAAALLARKRPGAHPDYDREPFERALRERFEIERTEELAGGTRILYFARPR